MPISNTTYGLMYILRIKIQNTLRLLSEVCIFWWWWMTTLSDVSLIIERHLTKMHTVGFQTAFVAQAIIARVITRKSNFTAREAVTHNSNLMCFISSGVSFSQWISTCYGGGLSNARIMDLSLINLTGPNQYFIIHEAQNNIASCLLPTFTTITVVHSLWYTLPVECHLYEAIVLDVTV